MKDGRLFFCALCHQQTIICSSCDTGQLYCSSDCSGEARRISCRAAEKRYQKTYVGRCLHAARQSRYRERQKQKVTDHTCLPPPSSDVLNAEPEASDGAPIVIRKDADFCCDFCGDPVSPLLRRDFFARCGSLSQQESVLPSDPNPK